MSFFLIVKEDCYTCFRITARFVKFTGKQLQTNDCVDKDYKKDEQGYVKQRYHGAQY